MASKALRGLTIEIGGDTTELNKALDNVDKKTRSLSSELGDINRALKLDPTNIELVAQKQKVLADAVDSTKERLGLLKEAEKQAQKQFERGEITEEQYRALRREVIATESKLKKLTEQAEELAEATDDVADSAEDVSHELEDEADSADDAEKETEDLDEASDDLASGGLAAVAAAAAAAVAAIVALAEESREYRTEMAKLDTAFQNVGFSAEAATKTYEALHSVLGDTGQAVEASNMLAKLCTTEEELNQWTEILTGVYGTFGSSLPIEALAESANESARVGQIAGNLADAISWATATGETFGVTLKENTKANEEWNAAVESATTAEDYFNLALQDCADEQERQQLITKTLTDLYGGAAKKFKDTNKEVIRANEATEKWNKSTAKIGEAVEPMVNDIKELGVALLEDASEPLEDIANYIRKTVIPAITKVGKWVRNNGPTIEATVIGITTAMVAFKVATIATTIAQKGLAGAIKATAVAQKVLNLVQKATPMGLLLAGVVAVTAALTAYTAATKKAKEPIDVLTKEEKELMAAAQEAAEAFRDQQAATEESFRTITAEMGEVQKLADELLALADSSGKVKKEDKERADLLLGKLNDALGTEYTMTGRVIDNYKELKKSIDEVIKSKNAEALLEAGKGDYLDAVTNEVDAWNTKESALKAYEAQLDETLKAREVYDQREAELQQAREQRYPTDTINRLWEDAQKAKKAWETEKGYLEDKEAAYDKAKGAYENYRLTIDNYTKAQEAALNGEYQTVIDLFSRKGEVYAEHTDTVDEETAKVIATLEKAAVDAGLAAQTEKENFEKGMAGYTEESVKEAEEGYQEALSKWATAYTDAQGLGEDFGQGLADGIRLKDGVVGAAAIAQIRNAVKAAKEAAEINSPSKKMIAIGEGLGEGTEVGIENTTTDVKKAATKQMADVLNAYGSPDQNAQKVYRNIAEQQSARQLSGQQALASSNGPMLEKILAAIEKGQVIALDGDAIVGATADRMDSALGRRRTLASRGAI